MLKRVFTGIVIITVLMVLIIPFKGVIAQPSESELMAAYIYNFAKFVQWPEEEMNQDDSIFVIGIVGDNPFDGLKKSVDGKKIRNQEVIVIDINDFDSLKICNMLFICASEKENYDSLLNIVSDESILTVGEHADFADAGGIIGFYLKDNKVRFKINLEAAHQANLNISSKLLKLADLCKSYVKAEED